MTAYSVPPRRPAPPGPACRRLHPHLNRIRPAEEITP
jgi:hypothetical protein